MVGTDGSFGVKPDCWSAGAKAPSFREGVVARLKPCPSTEKGLRQLRSLGWAREWVVARVESVGGRTVREASGWDVAARLQSGEWTKRDAG
jgi:hypothetical protein